MARRYIHGKRKRRSPLKDEKIESFKQTKSKDQKTSLSTIGTLGLKSEFEKKKLEGFGALVLGRKIGDGEAQANVSKILEYSPELKSTSNITSLGGGYKNPKGLYLGGSVERGRFKGPHHDVSTSWTPKLNIKKTTKKGNVYSLKIGKDSGMIGVKYKF